MKAIHSRRLAIALSALLAASMLAGCGKRLTAEERVELARTQLSQGDAASAAIQLRNVLQDDPANVPARVLLADAALRGGDFDTAAKEYRRALDLGADIEQFRIGYAEALVRFGDGAEALRITDPDVAGEAPQVVYWRALAYLRTGDAEIADRLLAGIAGEASLQPAVTIAQARVALVSRGPRQALDILAPVAAAAAEYSDYWEIVAFARLQAGEPEGAAEAFRMAARTVNDASGIQRFGYRAGEVDALLAAGELDEARRKAQELRAAGERHPVANFLMARVELQSGNPQQALAYGQAVLAAQPDSSIGHMIVGAAHQALDQPTQAERHFERAIQADPGNQAARRMLAQARLGMASPERALEALGPLAAEPSDAQTAALAGMASVRAGDPESAVRVLRRQLEQEPRNDELRSMLAVSLMAAGRTEEALAELGRVSGDDVLARQRADLIAIAAHLQDGQVARAREAAQVLADANPESAPLRINLGGLFLAGNRIDEAAAWLEDGLRLAPRNPAAHFNLGRIAAAQGRLPEAEGHFEIVVADNPANSAAQVALAQVQWVRGDREAAVARLEGVRSADAGDAATRVVLSGFLLDSGRPADALAVAREAVAAAPQSPEAFNALANAQLGNGEPAEAEASFGQAHRLVPSRPLYLVGVARARASQGQLEPARESLINALALDPGYTPALSALVDVERRLGRLAGAADALARLERATSPGNPGVAQLRGELLLAQEDYAGAERAFAAAYEGGVGGRAAVGQYEARRRAGQPDPAEPLRAWLERQPDDAVARTALADHYLRADDYPAAIRQYEVLAADMPDNAALLNNLAWLYGRVGDNRARAMAEQARALAPDSPMIADTLGWILYQAGDLQAALALIGPAAAQAPHVGEIQYHHAVLLAETGDREGAKRAARAVLAEPSATQHHERAQALLNQLEQGKE